MNRTKFFVPILLYFVFAANMLLPAQSIIVENNTAERDVTTEVKNRSIVKTIVENSSLSDLETIAKFPVSSDFNKANNTKTNFFHSFSNTTFPFFLLDFERTNVSLKQKNDISATYSSSKDETTINIHLISSTTANEGRLRNHYRNSLQKIKQNNAFSENLSSQFLKFEGNNYICNGVECFSQNENSENLLLQTYECGSWMLDIEMESKKLPIDSLDLVVKNIVNYINPSRLTGVKPLNLKPNIDFETEALKDIETVGAMVASALKKADWASSNVDKKERASGFPDIYLNMHVEALEEYLKILSKKNSRSKNQENVQFFNELKLINEAGFLKEYIFDSFEELVFVPSYVTLNMEKYLEWKQQQKLVADFHKKRYTINYRALPY